MEQKTIETIETIEKYELAGFTGSDVSLEISLFEYGLINRWDDKNQEWIFIYGTKHDDENDCWVKFNWSSAANIQEYNWANFQLIANWTGMTLSEWLKMKTPQQVTDLVGYYGAVDVFSDYDEGFEVGREQ